jgi:RNA-directed DNA polymerase
MLVERLSLQTGRSVSQLHDFAMSAGRKYKIFEIPKRSGGTRLIEQPAKSVKAVQRWLVKSLFSRYLVHPCVKGYRAKLSIYDNASAHAQFRYTLRADFKDFFWSFRSEDVERFLRSNVIEGVVLSELDIAFVVGVVSREGRLVMGAPSSPMLTNIMMYDVDSAIASVAREHHAVYTRYADDLFLSSNVAYQSGIILKEIQSYLRRDDLPSLCLNDKKTLFLSKKFHREVTGLVITSDGRISLGRDKKRMLKAMLFRSLQNQLTDEERGQLSGYLNWAASVDPAFLDTLRLKYGAKVVLDHR